MHYYFDKILLFAKSGCYSHPPPTPWWDLNGRAPPLIDLPRLCNLNPPSTTPANDSHEGTNYRHRPVDSDHPCPLPTL
jgi:hypothetical protein